MSWVMVVNCFKMCIFALARTTSASPYARKVSVVNCFKMCIFALARTTGKNEYELGNGL